MAYKNKADQAAASKRHYEANKETYLDRNRKYRRKLNELLNGLKEKTPCSDCGKSYPYYVMDFDHLDGEQKDGLVSFFRATGRTKALEREILKCQIVCANCHRQRTYERLQKVT